MKTLENNEFEAHSLKAVLDRVKKATVPVDQVDYRLQKVKAELAKAEKLHADLFGIEAETAIQVKQKIRDLQNEQGQLERQKKSNLRYARMDLEPLKWRDAQGFPKFALFSIDVPHFEIRSHKSRFISLIKGEGTSFITPVLPEQLEDYYLDVVNKLARKREISKWIKASLGAALAITSLVAMIIGGVHARSSNSPPDLIVVMTAVFFTAALFGGITVLTRQLSSQSILSLRATYQGVIPAPVREKIHEVQKDFEAVYILAEVPKWELKKIARPLPDPLVLGFANGSLWLIESYDTTPTEEYLKREFSS